MSSPVANDVAVAAVFFHPLEGVVDLFEGDEFGDQLIDFDFALHIPVDEAGELAAAAAAAEGGAGEDAAGDQHPRGDTDVLSRPGNADESALAAAVMDRLERLAHDRRAAGRLEGEVRA